MHVVPVRLLRDLPQPEAPPLLARKLPERLRVLRIAEFGQFDDDRTDELRVGRIYHHRLQRVGAHLIGLRERELARLVHRDGVEPNLFRQIQQRHYDADRADHFANRSQVLQCHGVLRPRPDVIHASPRRHSSLW
jgi:hypothetical protein